LTLNIIFNFLNKYNIFCNEQYGFRPEHSTELALADVIDKLYNSLDQNKTCIGVFLDLSKAFDTIDHAILLSKLHHYGIRGTTLNWIDSYISNRYQYTSYKNTNSHLAGIQCGVPQGSILGPLLFIIYVNDICHVSEIANIILFADDTNIFFESDATVNSFHITVSRELDKLNDWFAANK
ncbi:reverse transcriptase domain-containing protein, partial [Salmonella sp. S146_54837]|uniref:reverse transcriptase domain-containing protein n=1 Tax=Salmonella sp. S146_54837 TaxID=2665635 RepID=UPI001CA8A148